MAPVLSGRGGHSFSDPRSGLFSTDGPNSELALLDLVAADLRRVHLVAEPGSRRDAKDSGCRELDERYHVVVDEPAGAWLDVGRILAVGEGRQVNSLRLPDTE